jgi:hypothetical protein
VPLGQAIRLVTDFISKFILATQNDLVTVLGQFDPKLVKMAPGGERPED